ncbi:MAG TPA: hypothetical protein VHF00_01595 [Acidimicrobiales bacterium]|nr:hypothetical protein [Acidimicrobiales bacterium]
MSSLGRPAHSTGGRSRLLIVLVVLVAGVACSSGGDDPAVAPPTAAPAPTQPPEPPVTFGLWGDMPYTDETEPKVGAMIAEMNAADLAFSVFDGDIKGGGPCADRVYADALARFNSLAAPLVYVPGDNEWTDCLGSADPLERLGHLRRVLCAGDRSLGRRTMPLERQSREYPEHTRWRAGGVVFVGLHVVGSNNGKVTDPNDVRSAAQRAAANAEHQGRDAAVRAWMRDSFDMAIRDRAAGVMLVIQANPGFDVVSADDRAGQQLDGFDAFLDALRAETVRFAKPVALVHGDTHRYRLDHPLLERSGAPIPNLVRLETWGHPFVSWVKATVDASDPAVFRFEPQRFY